MKKFGAGTVCVLPNLKCLSLGWNRKGELRKIEGTGVIEDIKNPAKLGITYSYGKQMF